MIDIDYVVQNIEESGDTFESTFCSLISMKMVRAKKRMPSKKRNNMWYPVTMTWYTSRVDGSKSN